MGRPLELGEVRISPILGFYAANTRKGGSTLRRHERREGKNGKDGCLFLGIPGNPIINPEG
jgi:hypothetical protein